MGAYPRVLDNIQALLKSLRSLFGILGSNEDLHRNLATF